VGRVELFFYCKPWLLPNRHFLLQLIDDPLTGSKRFFPMQTGHAQKKRWLPNGDKSDSVMNDNNPKSKVLRGLLGNLSQLMVGHFSMRFIFNSIDLASILNAPNDPREIDDRPGSEGIILRRPKWCVGQ
jgi:hypothetical protein